MISIDSSRRYARNVALSEIGENGQQKLLAAKILIIGSGGLGSPVALYLAAAGVGTIGIVDNDRVELSNLQRQILFETADIARSKAEAAADALYDLNPEINVIPHVIRVTSANAKELFAPYDIIADGSDNIDTRFLANDMCYALKKPLIFASVLGFEGHVATFKAYETGPCYRCLYPEPPPADSMPSCVENGVLGAAAGVIGCVQATEIIKEILGIGESLSGYFLRFNMLNNRYNKTRLLPDRECPLCAQK